MNKSKTKSKGGAYFNIESNSTRKKRLLQANEEDDKAIRRLEKLLKFKKKKKKKLGDDALDYLLEALDRKEGDDTLSDGTSECETPDGIKRNKVSVSSKRNLKNENVKSPPPKKSRTLTDLLREKEGYVSEDENGEQHSDSEHFAERESFLSDDDISDSASVNTDENTKDNSNNKKSQHKKCINSADKKERSEIWEDIYGRFRDKEGNVIKKQENGKYVPPGLRETNPDADKNEQLSRIKRNLKGLLNRLSESNLQSICFQIEEVYMKNGRNDVNETLFGLISELVLTTIQTAPRLIMEQAMLIALLHANVGAEIGAYFLQHLVEKLDSLFRTENYGEGKICNNVLTFLSHLYNFKVAHSTLIFDIFRKLIDSFASKDIELIQLFLKNIGFVLRKDDPTNLKEIIVSIQAKAASVKKEENDSRVNFMLDTLTAIRNNNIYKIPDYDPSVIDHSRKVLRTMVRKGCSLQELAISYEDLIKADERGRWWIVGSAWSEREHLSASNDNESNDVIHEKKYSEKILELARKLHMNTDVRKSVFCIIMTAEDYMDAFEKLLKLNLNHHQSREIMNVILHCSLNEKNYNPYYSYLAGKFSSFDRKFLLSLKFSLWEKFKELNKMKQQQVKNLAKFLIHCFISLALPLSVLKVIHFSDMDKTMLKFIRQILIAILLHDSEETCMQVFKKISLGKNLNLLRESLCLFMHHFLLKDKEKYSPEITEKLVARVKVAETVLHSGKKSMDLY